MLAYPPYETYPHTQSQTTMLEYKTPRAHPIIPPHGQDRVLLHSCCAPCAGEMIEAMVESEIQLTVFFYNPNIHPQKEYELRKNENIRYCKQLQIPFIDADYDVTHWFSRARGLEWEPERGKRCTMCFDLRFERTALYAHENNFPLWATSLGISRWKNLEQINDCGHRASQNYPEVAYWDFNWRQQGGSARMYEIAKRENFYQQQYCGCIYSLRDSNRWREANGRKKIALGATWYQEHPDSETQQNTAHSP